VSDHREKMLAIAVREVGGGFLGEEEFDLADYGILASGAPPCMQVNLTRPLDDDDGVREPHWQNQPGIGVGNPCFSEHQRIALERKV